MKTFQEMPLADEIQSALTDLQFINPTKIQTAVIPVALEGRDLMACAETGSGKTGAYGIPMVTQLLEDQEASALILAPTRELAHQISEFLRELTTHCQGIQVVSLVGGADIRKQLKALKRRPRIIVATPGRLTDHLRRRSVSLKNTGILVLDEGDRMLDMGFAPQLDVILEYLPETRQTSLFTATLPQKVQKLAEKYLSKPKNVNVGRTSLPVASIKQSVVQVAMKEKDERIVDELNLRSGSVIVFLKTKHRTDKLAKHLKSYGFRVDLLHGGRTQGQRNKAIQSFKAGTSRILCATDVAARGIDVPSVEHVINFDLPMMDEDYVHRIGRTARNGAKGEAVSFVTPQEHHAWQTLVRKYKIPGVDLKSYGKGGKGKKKNIPTFKSRENEELSLRDKWSQSHQDKKKKKSFAKRPPRDDSAQDDGFESRPSKPGGFKKKFSKAGGFKKKFSKPSGFKKKPSQAGEFKEESPKSGDFKKKSTKAGGFKKKSTQAGTFKKKTSKAGGFKKKSTKAGTFKKKTSKAGGFKKKSSKPGGFKKKSSKAGGFSRPTRKSGGRPSASR